MEIQKTNKQTNKQTNAANRGIHWPVATCAFASKLKMREKNNQRNQRNKEATRRKADSIKEPQ